VHDDLGHVVGHGEGDDLVQDRAERVDVGALVDDAVVPGLFGRHVSGRTAAIAGALVLAECHAPVEDHDLAVGADQDVRRLEVAVDDALAVGVLGDLADLDEVAEQAAERVVAVAALLLLER
jgi:hypothetical protein